MINLTYDELFILFARNNEIFSYLKILGLELKTKLIEETIPKHIYNLLCLIEKICDNKRNNIINIFFTFIFKIIHNNYNTFK